MPVAPTYPGVYVEELPSDVHTITGVSTAVAAFIGNFSQGPMNQPVTVFSIADVERGFGSLASNSEAGYAVRQFFTNGGAQAVIVRVAAGTPVAASIQLGDGTTPVLQADAANIGVVGDFLRLSVDYDTTPAGRFNLTVTRVDSSTPPAALATEVYQNLSLDPSDPNYAVSVVNDASSLIHLSLVGAPAATDLPASTGTWGGDISGLDLTMLNGLETTVNLNGADLANKLTFTANPASLNELATTLQSALRALGSPSALPSATVQVSSGPGTERHLQISASDTHPEWVLTFKDEGAETLAAKLGLNGVAGNVQQYALGGTAAGQASQSVQGSDAPVTASIQLGDGTTPVLQADAANPGVWGNSIRLSVDHDTTPAGRFNLTVTLVNSSTPPGVVATEVYRNLSLDPSDPNYAVSVVNDASSLIHLSLAGTPAATDLPASTGTRSGDISGLDLTSLTGLETTVNLNGKDLTDKLTFTANPASLSALAAMLQTALRALGTTSALPSVAVQLLNGPGTERHLQISASDTHPEWVLTFNDEGTEAFGAKLALDGVPGNVQQYALGGTKAGQASGSVLGNDGRIPDATALIGDQGSRTGIHALATANFNLLCLPDTFQLADTDASAVISAATTYCQSVWAFLLVDPPQETPDQDGTGQRDKLVGIEQWLADNSTLRSSYAALYYPRPRIPDPLNGYRLRSVAASGTIAGIYARTDTDRGVWKAPAGTASTLVNVPALTYQATDAENGALNPLAINCLRNLPVYGNVCWGARTLDGADQIGSQWKYVPVRRLALYIEASLYQGTQWVVFEPNDEPLWAQIRLNVGTFMQQLFRQGAFQGSTPNSAYFVRCDSTTTTQADINLGMVNIVVGFAPLLPAEFVVLQIQQIAGQTPS